MLVWATTNRFGKARVVLGAKFGYRTNTYTSGGGDRMARVTLIKQFKNAVMLSRCE